jgi:hypothetical protein
MFLWQGRFFTDACAPSTLHMGLPHYTACQTNYPPYCYIWDGQNVPWMYVRDPPNCTASLPSKLGHNLGYLQPCNGTGWSCDEPGAAASRV